MSDDALEMKSEYCVLTASEKYNMLLNCPGLQEKTMADLFELTDDEGCTNGESEIILDLDTDGILETRLQSYATTACNEDCQKLKMKTEQDIEAMIEHEEHEVDYFTKMKEGIDLFASFVYERREVNNNREQYRQELLNQVDQTFDGVFEGSDNVFHLRRVDEEKEKMKQKINDAMDFDPGALATYQNVYDSVLNEVRVKSNNLEKTYTNRNMLKRAKNQVKRHFKTMSNTDKLSKVSTTFGSCVGAIPKFQSNDPLQITSGVLDIATSILDFAPPPFSLIAGTINSILNIFVGGGGPSTEDVIKDEFKKQKDFIEKAFKKQEAFIQEQLAYQSLSEQIIAGKSDLETLSVKHDFIQYLRQFDTATLDDVADGIITEMSYFEHREAVADLRHALEILCEEAFENVDTNDQDRACHLIFTIIMAAESDRALVFAEFIALLKLTSHYKALATGYVNADLNDLQLQEEFLERVTGNSQLIAGLLLNKPDLWEDYGQRLNAIGYLNRTLTGNNIAAKLKHINWDLPPTGYKKLEGTLDIKKNNHVETFETWTEFWTFKFTLKIKRTTKDSWLNIFAMEHADDKILALYFEYYQGKRWLYFNRNLNPSAKISIDGQLFKLDRDQEVILTYMEDLNNPGKGILRVIFNGQKAIGNNDLSEWYPQETLDDVKLFLAEDANNKNIFKSSKGNVKNFELLTSNKGQFSRPQFK